MDVPQAFTQNIKHLRRQARSLGINPSDGPEATLLAFVVADCPFLFDMRDDTVECRTTNIRYREHARKPARTHELMSEITYNGE